MSREISRRVVLACLLATAVAPAPAAAQSPMIPEDGGLVPVEAGRLHVEQGGSGSRTLVLIHDGFTDAAVWQDIWPILGREYRLVRFDRRGFGRSPAATAAYSPVDDILAVMRRAGVQRAAFLAGSDGAGLALEFALAHPEMVEQLLLVSPVVSGGPANPPSAQHFAANGSSPETWVADRYLVSGPNRSARARLRQIYAASPQDVGRGPDRWARPLPPLLPRLGGIRAPVLILSGARDLPDLVALSQTVQRAIPGARRDPVQGSGHLIYIDEPEIFAAAALGFFRSYGSHGT
jgi:pimeloyl-ACP methyl ester carboxylesterase